ncbi:MAG: type II secretion system protein [Desulfamplus sp.]|nr:type II secretion system protein [Desulfamplus sp.]
MTLTSKAGNLNRVSNSGFTLIELIVVLAVMGSVLFITLPKFRTLTFDDTSERGLNILLNTVKDLKKKALSDGMDYILHLDVVKSVMWVTSASIMSEAGNAKAVNRVGQQKMVNTTKSQHNMMVNSKSDQIDNIDNKKAKENATPLPDSVYITGVEIYGLSNSQPQEEYQIRFSGQGYCDMAIIHLKERESGEEIEMVIEPFLNSAKIIRKHISFDQCR